MEKVLIIWKKESDKDIEIGTISGIKRILRFLGKITDAESVHIFFGDYFSWSHVQRSAL